MRVRKACLVEGCDRPQIGTYDYCKMHTQRLRRGKPLGTAAPSRIIGVPFAELHRPTEEGCWEWAGAVSSTGYGQFRGQYAHRHSYELKFGPIPVGLVIDHLCRNTRCVNPAHLEAVTQRANILRGTVPSALCVAMNRCARGHEFTPENTSIRRDGARRCLACRDATNAARYRGSA